MSFSPVVQVRKLIGKMKTERSSPRLKRFPSRTLSEEARDSLSEIPPYKYKKSKQEHVVYYTGENQFRDLPPEAVLYITSFLDSKDLCCLSQVSKEMYSFANDEIIWKELAMFDWGIDAPFASTWKESYSLLEDLFKDGIWEGMSKWVEPAGFDNEQKTTARLQFVKRSRNSQQMNSSVRSCPTAIHRVDSSTATVPIVKSDSGVANIHKDAPHRIIGSGVTVNCTTPSPFRIEGSRTIQDQTGCSFEWNKVFEKHTSLYSGKMSFADRTVTGTIDYDDGATKWKGIFSYTKMRSKAINLVLA